jgi:NAD(P)-dependent dehydrogenase (short-subunit alcohol dehydrogenase family)
MAGRVAGKVAFITGAARGQGRSHAIRLAQEGADIIAVDLAGQIGSVPYAMSAPEDLAETVKEVEALDRRIVATQADVRDYGAVKAALDDGVAQLGHLDIVSANAGIFSFGSLEELDETHWQDMIRRSVVLLVDVSGSMRGERIRTAAATVGALAAELDRDDLAVVAFWSDAAVLSHLGQHVPAQQLLEEMLRIPAKGLTNIAFPLRVAATELARVPARDARVVLLSDCVHNAGPDPRPLAARLSRLDVLLDTSGEQDEELARELARLGRGRLRRIRAYTDVAPALSAVFAS